MELDFSRSQGMITNVPHYKIEKQTKSGYSSCFFFMIIKKPHKFSSTIHGTLFSFAEKKHCKRKEKKMALCFPLLKKKIVKEKKRK
jgi:hypothetical protein